MCGDMKTLLLFGLLTAGGLYVTLEPAVAAPGGLQGKWKITAAPKDWKIAPGTNVVVTAEDIRIRVGPVTGSVLHYSADYASGNIQATKGSEKPRLGKFNLAGETLSLVVGEPGAERPGSTSASGPGMTRWVFKRMQKTDE